MRLEDALQQQEDAVDSLLREANKYIVTLKRWKKACQAGNINELLKSLKNAQNIAGEVPDLTERAASTWQFDLEEYLSGDAWQRELIDVAKEKYGLPILSEMNIVLSAPVSVKAQPGRARLLIGKAGWPNLRPSVVAKELHRLRERALESASQELLESLFTACKYLQAQGQSTGKKQQLSMNNNSLFAKFRSIYDLFCMTPGWKRENSPAVFSQAIYALHSSGIRTTRAGRPFEFEFPSGRPNERDIFAVVGEDGRPIRYYGIHFR